MAARTFGLSGERHRLRSGNRRAVRCVVLRRRSCALPSRMPGASARSHDIRGSLGAARPRVLRGSQPGTGAHHTRRGSDHDRGVVRRHGAARVTGHPSPVAGEPDTSLLLLGSTHSTRLSVQPGAAADGDGRRDLATSAAHGSSPRRSTGVVGDARRQLRSEVPDGLHRCRYSCHCLQPAPPRPNSECPTFQRPGIRRFGHSPSRRALGP